MPGHPGPAGLALPTYPAPADADRFRPAGRVATGRRPTPPTLGPPGCPSGHALLAPLPGDEGHGGRDARASTLRAQPARRPASRFPRGLPRYVARCSRRRPTKSPLARALFSGRSQGAVGPGSAPCRRPGSAATSSLARALLSGHIHGTAGHWSAPCPPAQPPHCRPTPPCSRRSRPRRRPAPHTTLSVPVTPPLPPTGRSSGPSGHWSRAHCQSDGRCRHRRDRSRRGRRGRRTVRQ